MEIFYQIPEPVFLYKYVLTTVSALFIISICAAPFMFDDKKDK